MAEGEFALLQTHLEAGLEKSAAMGAAEGSNADVYALLVDAAALQRDATVLQKYAPLAEESATYVDHKLNIAIADRAWGVLHTLAGDFAQAERRLKRALETFNSYPAPWQVGRTLLDLGEMAKANGKTEQARQYFSEALSAFEGLRATPFVERTRAALASLDAG